MIGKITGKVDSTFEDHVIIDVGGVGYLIYISAMTLHKLDLNSNCELFINTHVREDHIHLYGFLSLEEKSFFNLLQTVGGIGAKMAMTILSFLTPEKIQIAVSTKDKDAFRSISGVGPKMAERILIELKDKVSGHAAALSNELKLGNASYNAPSSISSDAIAALISLGINRAQAYNTVANIITHNPTITINELIRQALQNRVE